MNHEIDEPDERKTLRGNLPLSPFVYFAPFVVLPLPVLSIV